MRWRRPDDSVRNSSYEWNHWPSFPNRAASFPKTTLKPIAKSFRATTALSSEPKTTSCLSFAFITPADCSTRTLSSNPPSKLHAVSSADSYWPSHSTIGMSQSDFRHVRVRCRVRPGNCAQSLEITLVRRCGVAFRSALVRCHPQSALQHVRLRPCNEDRNGCRD